MNSRLWSEWSREAEYLTLSNGNRGFMGVFRYFFTNGSFTYSDKDVK